MVGPTRPGPYLGFHRALHASDGRNWRDRVDPGCIGPCARGRQLLTWVHEHIALSPLPNGWNVQVRDESGAVVRFEYARQLRHEALAPLAASVFVTPLAGDLRRDHHQVVTRAVDKPGMARNRVSTKSPVARYMAGSPE